MLVHESSHACRVDYALWFVYCTESKSRNAATWISPHTRHIGEDSNFDGAKQQSSLSGDLHLTIQGPLSVDEGELSPSPSPLERQSPEA
jgi:hypothetical protein